MTNTTHNTPEEPQFLFPKLDFLKRKESGFSYADFAPLDVPSQQNSQMQADLMDFRIEDFALDDSLCLDGLDIYIDINQNNNSNLFPSLLPQPVSVVKECHQVIETPSTMALEEPETKKEVINQSRRIKKEKPRTQKIQGTKRTFYEKNICRNIVRKAIRSIESELYDADITLQLQTARLGLSLEEFRIAMVHRIESLNGPSHLKAFLQGGAQEARAFKTYLLWFLKERYIREALDEGHMSNLAAYLEYKNMTLLPMLR